MKRIILTTTAVAAAVAGLAACGSESGTKTAQAQAPTITEASDEPETTTAAECQHGGVRGMGVHRERCVNGEWRTSPAPQDVTPPQNQNEAPTTTPRPTTTTTPPLQVDPAVAMGTAVAAGVPAEAVCNWPTVMPAGSSRPVGCPVVNPDASEGTWNFTLFSDMTISEPLYTETKAPPAPPAVFDGSGSTVLDLGQTYSDKMLLIASNDGDSNFIIRSLSEDLSEAGYPVNEIGPIGGTYLLNENSGDTTRYLEIDAEGNWHIEVMDVSWAKHWDGSAPLVGQGSDVFVYDGGPGLIDYSNDGDSNFIVTDQDYDLVINEIGPIAGTTTISGGPVFVTVDAEGSWSLTVRPI